MVLFALGKYEAMGATLQPTFRGMTGGRFKVARFDNGELYVNLHAPVCSEPCVVIGSIAPPDEQLLSLLLLTHTLKKEGASKVIGLLPYLGYSRQDKDKPGQSLAMAWAGSMAKAAGLDQVITVDVHSEADKRLFPIPLISLSTAQLFAKAIQEHQLTQATIVAPDNGAITRCEAVRVAAGMPAGEIPYFEKRRIETGIVHAGPIGKVGAQVVIIDDILDTGTTLVSACERLVAVGAREIYIMVTHGQFTGERWKDLWSVRVKRIFCTDTLPLPAGLDPRIRRLSIIPLLQRQLLSFEQGNGTILAVANSGSFPRQT